MSVIHMEVEQVESTLATLKRMHETWEYATDLRNMIASLQGGGWQGSSADQFYIAYNDVVRQFASQTQALLTLTQRLSRELAEWQEMARSFGGAAGAGAAAGGAAAAGAGAAAGNDPATGASSRYRYSGMWNFFDHSDKGAINTKVNNFLNSPKGQEVFGNIPPDVLNQVRPDIFLDSKAQNLKSARVDGNVLKVSWEWERVYGGKNRGSRVETMEIPLRPG